MVESNKLQTPQAVIDLVTRFHDHRDTYKKQTYNETQVRREFIDPLFTALGWDVDNRAGHAEAYKDVIHEDAIKVGGSTKAPDYCFRIGGVRKFFVEAKRPSVDVKDGLKPAYQLRRYAWTSKLPLSIVTDFEEFSVYDCRIKPKQTDPPATARVLYLTYDQYTDRWDDIASIFSKDAIYKGSFDKYAESNRRKRGTAEVDDEFLKEIEHWRELLARNIALRNANLSVRELNFAVAKTIDRIIFLRMCEDRGVETYAQLRILPNGPNIYPRLVELFRRADERYNSGLFHFELEKGRSEAPDTLTPNLTIDDKTLKEIITRLYYPECPYEFSVLPAEILGQVYEQFLGKVIRLTKGGRAVVEEKPEVKKAGGVYYTPKYIVDYIVEHTVGKLLEGKTPAGIGSMLDHKPSRKRKRPVNPNRAREEAAYAPNRARKEAAHIQYRDRKGAANTLRILDPACGSGSFLLGAYQYLLDWHLNWYTENDPKKWAKKKTPPIYQAAVSNPYRDRKGAARDQNRDRKGVARDQNHDREGVANWRLTVSERKRILLNNIYGVDIDPQAVEVTKLSLLLRVLEGESQESLDNQLKLFHERALPDLGHNIKCGNSLIGPDFYENQQMTFLDEEERYRINVFDWETEFPEVFQYPDRKGGASVPNTDRKEAASIPNPDRQGGTSTSTLSCRESTNRHQAGHQEPLPHGRGTDQTPDPQSGFDAVIGNPPYVLLQALGTRDVFDYFSNSFDTAKYKIDTYILFLERAWKLSRDRGFIGFITPNTFLRNKHSISLRELMLYESEILLLTLFDFSVFRGASVDTAIAISQKVKHVNNAHEVSVMRSPSPGVYREAGIIEQKVWDSRDDKNFDLPKSEEANRLLERLSSQPSQLGDIATAYFGIQTYDRKRYVSKEQRYEYWKPTLDGENIQRYRLAPPSEWMDARPEAVKSGGKFSVYEQERIGVRQIGSSPIATLLPPGWYSLNTIYNIFFTRETLLSLRFVLGILSSRLIRWYWEQMFFDQKKTFPKIKKAPLLALPLPYGIKVDIDRRHDSLVSLVEQMLSLHKQLDAAKTPTDKTAIQRQIDVTDRQIDNLVYELYGLTDDEIRIVEEATSS